MHFWKLIENYRAGNCVSCVYRVSPPERFLIRLSTKFMFTRLSFSNYSDKPLGFFAVLSKPVNFQLLGYTWTVKLIIDFSRNLIISLFVSHQRRHESGCCIFTGSPGIDWPMLVAYVMCGTLESLVERVRRGERDGEIKKEANESAGIEESEGNLIHLIWFATHEWTTKCFSMLARDFCQTEAKENYWEIDSIGVLSAREKK